MTAGRTLRPLHLFTDGEVLWAVDEFQPVAALLDAAGGALRGLVSWPRLPPPAPDESWQVLSAGPDLWVQPGTGAPVARIGPAGLLAAGYSAGRRLVAAESRGAWCAGPHPVPQLVTGPEFDPGPLPHDVVIVVGPDGEVRRIGVDRPVVDVHVTEDGVYLEVEDGPHVVTDLGAGLRQVSWRRAWLRIPGGPLPSYVEISEAVRPILPLRRIAGAPGELRRLDPGSVAIAGSAIDITGQCWPLPPEPVDAASYARSQRDRLGDVDGWTAGLTGSWPDTRLVIAFDHVDYPGIRLWRGVRLFDEIGRITPPDLAEVHLREDIETGNLPPAGDAVDGRLEV